MVDELDRVAGPARAGRWRDRLQEATVAYDRERWADARRLLVPLAERVPAAGAVRELLGLTLYRLGRYRDAIRELEAAEQLTGSVDQHPVMADCYRALNRRADVERLWGELRRGGAGVDVVIEGRIVTAASRADAGDVAGAIALLEQGPVDVRRPRTHHLRLWYALAGLHERAGNVPVARELFRRVALSAPDFADAAGRLAGLGG